ncbi:MAG: HlyD family efflux transporter periplasmic adaptor subunit [Oculatellaceae cyanobacterium Prado106]|jgi:HlyD family secretion protein|nr:HlyD family efflux transporter periplasmic adaptor subunit [Oculatellaceae cyanobacterium Prado106]
MVNRRNGAMNGTSTNGNGNGNGNGKGKGNGRLAIATAGNGQADAGAGQITRTEVFDQPVILQQPSIWSRAIAMGIVGITAFAIIWASVAKIEEAVPAQGQLKPSSQVQPVQAPVGGVVKELLVREGQRVKRGDVLIRFDPTVAQAQVKSFEQIIGSLERQNAFYRAQFGSAAPTSASQAQGLNVPPEVLALTSNRAALIEENRLFAAQLTGDTSVPGLSLESRARIQAGLRESSTRSAAAEFEVSQLQQQLRQTESQLMMSQRNLEIDQKIFGRLDDLAKEGGFAQLQVDRQQQQLIESQKEVDRLTQELSRLQYEIAGANQRLQNTSAVTDRDLLDRMGQNDKELASIDSQLNRLILDNEQRISETKSQLSQAQTTLRYSELRAPVDGVVFDLEPKGVGFVATNSEPIVQIVPGDGLIAEVFITNQDIGFVKEGMPVDVRVDSFPFSEFGDIKGTIERIGSDALPPDQEHRFYRFPAKIKLETQVIETAGKEIPVQSGMSISANIITRDRTVISIITDQFSRRVDSLKTVR